MMIVEDNLKMRQFIKSFILKRLEEVDTVYECACETAAITEYQRLHPEWVLMDIRLKSGDGISASQKILAADPNAQIVILTDYDEPYYRDAARQAGVKAFVMKEDLYELPGILRIFCKCLRS